MFYPPLGVSLNGNNEQTVDSLHVTASRRFACSSEGGFPQKRPSRPYMTVSLAHLSILLKKDSIMSRYRTLRLERLEHRELLSVVPLGGPSQTHTNIWGDTLNAVAGMAYETAVDGYNSASGNVTLHVNQVSGPPNDSFANRASISGSTATATGTNVNATKETSEPNHAGNSGGRSLWWTWTAPSSGPVQIDTIGSSFDTTLGVYTGSSVSSLTSVATDDDHGGNLTSKVTFNAVAGTAYQIAVDGYNSASGNVTLHVNQVSGPPNDSFANRASISGSTATATGTNVNATKETSEPNHAGNSGGRSLWWTWTAPSSGPVQIDTIGSSFDTTLGVYTGSSVSSLTSVATDDDHGGNLTSKVTFNAVAGTAYQIAVDGYNSASGNVTLHVNQVSGPPNDSFANRASISGSTATATGTNVNATKETSEPNHAGNSGGRSLWWTWTAPSSGPVQIDTIGSSFDTTLGVYTGSSVSSLTSVATDDDHGGNLTSKVTFNAVAGTAYQIAVDGYNSASGNVTLHVNQVSGPPNDSFANRASISGSTATATGTNVNATKETGEPNHAGNSGGRSLWWTWTAPSSGPVQIDTIGSSFDTTLGVYTGSSVSSLTSVATDDDHGGNLTSKVTFNAVAGTAYQIAVDGYNSASGNVTLHVNESGSARVVLDSNYQLLHVAMPATISGTAYMPNGSSMANASISVDDGISMRCLSVTTDGTGHFSFSATPVSPGAALVTFFPGSGMAQRNTFGFQIAQPITNFTNTCAASQFLLQNSTGRDQTYRISWDNNLFPTHDIIVPANSTSPILQTNERPGITFPFQFAAFGGTTFAVGDGPDGGDFSVVVDTDGRATASVSGGMGILLRGTAYWSTDVAHNDFGLCWSPGGDFGVGTLSASGEVALCFGTDGVSFFADGSVSHGVAGFSIQLA